MELENGLVMGAQRIWDDACAPVPVCRCDACGCWLCAGDPLYALCGLTLCEDCVRRARGEASAPPGGERP